MSVHHLACVLWLLAHSAAGTNTALGDSFIASRALGLDPWTDFDLRTYLQRHWHPGAPLGTTCGDLVRFDARDGHRLACNSSAIFFATQRRQRPCLSVSISNRMSSTAIADMTPGCNVSSIDLALERAPVRSSPAFARFAGQHVALLNLDCDGCEYELLPHFVQSTCTDQILVQVRARLPTGPSTIASRAPKPCTHSRTGVRAHPCTLERTKTERGVTHDIFMTSAGARLPAYYDAALDAPPPDAQATVHARVRVRHLRK